MDSMAACSPKLPIAENYTFNQKLYGRVRLAIESDVPHLHKLIHHLALYHNLPFEATESSISNNLFKSNSLPPFQSFTGLILEVSPNPFPPLPPLPQNDVAAAAAYSDFVPVTRELDVKDDYPIVDEESETFRSSAVGGEGGDGNVVIVAGYTLFYPHYFSFLENPGLFIDNIYIRKCYRGLGFGTTMFSVVASYAAKKGYSMIDQLVADWNVNSAKRFNKMGLQFVPDFRLSGKGLQAYANTINNSA